MKRRYGHGTTSWGTTSWGTAAWSTAAWSTAAWIVDTVGYIVGRRQLVRAARFALNRARLDLPNDATSNGEYALQRWLLASTPPGRAMTVLDVGGNIGEWSHSMLSQARHTGHADDLALHVFEPASATGDILAARLAQHARINRLAVSDAAGRATLQLVGAGAGTNSLYGTAQDTELVETTTLDDYVHVNGIERIDLLKVDTEGHDYRVLLGAERLFRERRIGVVQFEYNHRWILARHFLKDVFDLVEPFGYQVGKLTPRGVEPYPHWDPELESFIEGNYVAYAADVARWLPQISWWKRPV